MLSLYSTDSMRRLELDTVDTRFRLRGEETPPRDLVVVALDLETLGGSNVRFLDLPRSLYGRVFRRLHRDGARVIAFDVEITEPSDDPAQDFALYEAAGDAAPVVFATTAVDARGRTNVLGGDDNLRAIGARAGHASLPNDPRAVIRRVPYENDGLKSFAVVTTEMLTDRRLRPLDTEDGTAWIDYAGPPGTIPSISLLRVAQGRVPPGTFRGKIVVVGPTAASLQDLHPTSVGGEELMSGAEIQANAIDTARRGFPLRSGAKAWDVAAIVLLGLIAPLASLRLPAPRALALALATGALYLVVVQLAFNGGRVLAVVYPITALVLTGVGALTAEYFTETRERRRLRSLFSRFVPETVVDEVVDRAGSDLRLGGVERESTVLFGDLRGFTAFAERLRAEQVIDVLNHYLEEMSEAILDHGGTLVAYMGDGIMAVFGAPLELEDHADRALAAAEEMLLVRLGRFNAWLAERGLFSEFRMGIGVNSGPVMSGNVGSRRRLEYTAVGDTTNIASRLEAMTKGSGHQLFVAESTRALLRGDAPQLVLHGEVPVRGRERTIRVWTLREDVETSRAAVAHRPSFG